MIPLLTLLTLTGCASNRLLRVDNRLLQQQNTQLSADLQTCQQQAPPEDFATEVTLDVVRDYIVRAGMPEPTESAENVFVVPIHGENTDFDLAVQLFPDEAVLFMSTHDYMKLEQAESSQAMVLLLTQLATLNYELLLGKLQLNPRTGEIALSVELNLDDGLGYHTFEATVRHLLKTADDRYPDLLRAAQGQGI